MDPIDKASMLINDTTKTEELVEICKEASLSFAIITAIEGLYLRSPIINHDPGKKGRGGYIAVTKMWKDAHTHER